MGFASIADALTWLDDHIDYERTAPVRRSLPTLDTMRALTTAIGSPEQTFPSLHVTGTNGKGSVVALSSALLRAAGLSVGAYTSPNLSSVNERLAYDGAPIDDDAFCEVLGHLALIEDTLAVRPTRFELLTAAALWWFADVAVEAAVIEVGLGGSWDCTNVVNGEVAVLTNVSLDHTDVLGPTLEDIARDKSGIVKSGAIAVIGETNPTLVALIGDVARGVGVAAVMERGRDFACTQNQPAIGGRLLDLRTPGATYGDVFLPLFGRHQGDNAAVALMAVEAFLGRPLGEDVVAQAWAEVMVPGRLEVIGRHPLVILDGAHNVAGAQALGTALAEEWSVEGPMVAAVGMLEGRDAGEMVAPLARAGVSLVVACAPDSPRAQAAEVVAEAGRACGLDAVTAETVAEALSMARTAAGPEGLVVVAGSLYVVADARTANVPRS